MTPGPKVVGRFVALLRGVNVGGHNKIVMAELKAAFERSGFSQVSTYINSGNVLFDSDAEEADGPGDEAAISAVLQARCERVIADGFGLDIAVCVIAAGDLIDAVAHAPAWWGTTPDTRHDAFFVLPPLTAAQICDHVGAVQDDHEKVAYHGRVIFWSAPLATYSRTRWSKLAQDKTMYRAITVRNANTATTLARLAGTPWSAPQRAAPPVVVASATSEARRGV